MVKQKNKKKAKSKATQDAGASKPAAPKPVESTPVAESTSTTTPAVVPATLAPLEESTPTKPLDFGKSANSSTMDLKDAMNMSPQGESAPKEDPIPKMLADSAQEPVSKEPEVELGLKEAIQQKPKETMRPSTAEVSQETPEDQPTQLDTEPTPVKEPYVAPSASSSSSRPPTGVQDSHSSAADVKPPEPAHTSITKKNQIGLFDDEQAARPKTSSSGKEPSTGGSVGGVGKRVSTAEEREVPKKADKKEGGFKGLWNRFVAAFK